MLSLRQESALFSRVFLISGVSLLFLGFLLPPSLVSKCQRLYDCSQVCQFMPSRMQTPREMEFRMRDLLRRMPGIRREQEKAGRPQATVQHHTCERRGARKDNWIGRASDHGVPMGQA